MDEQECVINNEEEQMQTEIMKCRKRRLEMLFVILKQQTYRR